MKTILHLSSSSGPGGAERIVCALAASLDKTRYRSLVGLFRPGWLKVECEKRGLPVYILPNEGFMNWRWMKACYSLLREERVDLIQGHEFDANVHGAMIAALAGVPMVGTIHGKIYFWEKARRRIAYGIASRYMKVVAVSEDLRHFVAQHALIPEHRMHVIHNGVEEWDQPDAIEVAHRRSALGLDSNKLVVGVIGNLYPVKGHAYLLDGIPKVLEECPNTIFLLIGRGELEGILKGQAIELGIESSVRFMGLRDDIPKLLSVMDLFVMPSLSEGLSIALLEAMAAGKAVVVTKVGGNPEVVVDNQTGLLVPARDSAALANGIVSLLRDENRRNRFGEKGRKRVHEHFTIHAMTREYLNIYERILGAA